MDESAPAGKKLPQATIRDFFLTHCNCTPASQEKSARIGCSSPTTRITINVVENMDIMVLQHVKYTLKTALLDGIVI